MMKKYNVLITDEALSDMEELYRHIAFIIGSPLNAINQYDRIADGILSLEIFPERYRIMDSEPEHSMGMRKMPIDNYSVFYVIDSGNVKIISVLYSASDISRRLKR